MTAEGALFARAAQGDEDALFELAGIAAGKIRQGIPEAVGNLETLLRLAAAVNPALRLSLAGWLLNRGAHLIEAGEVTRGSEVCREGTDLLGEVANEGCQEARAIQLVMLQDLADEGCEKAATDFNSVLASIAPSQAAVLLKDVAERRAVAERSGGNISFGGAA